MGVTTDFQSNTTVLDVPTPQYTILDVPTPQYTPHSPISSLVADSQMPLVLQSPPLVQVSTVHPQVQFTYKDRRYTQAELDSYSNLTWAIVLFFFGVAEIGALLYRIDRKAIARCHPSICLFGYGSLPYLLRSFLRIITTGLGGSDADPRFPWDVEVLLPMINK